ncbi:hypothetical protein HMPREF0322_01429 [Desulfitobacterium hafniense DP7]|uniref:Uncharacterized protein n=1 Tax=Desulfitobacterium hafniense DP7 TaxID=537010 RepID=G9XKE6_DESHA|nr:hypothetical protein HMPREF0322_01429 [Desulfitobacterium hafniense DP7]
MSLAVALPAVRQESNNPVAAMVATNVKNAKCIQQSVLPAA